MKEFFNETPPELNLPQENPKEDIREGQETPEVSGAEDGFSGESPEEGREDYLSELSEYVKEFPETQNLDLETKEEIYNLQERKQEIVDNLKKQLKGIEDENYYGLRNPEERLVEFEKNTGKFIYEDESGDRRWVTLGEMITDAEWGIYYYLPAHSAPKESVKRYLIERAKSDLQDLLDKQIVRKKSEDTTLDEKIREAYINVGERMEDDRGKEKQMGVIAEKMVRNFLKKISIDGNLPFQVERTNIYQDIEQKIDFIIRRAPKERGVRVETGNIGVQFTVNPAAKERKEKQIRKSQKTMEADLQDRESFTGTVEISDILLVEFSMEDVSGLAQKWEEEGRPAGGPDQYLSKEAARELLGKLTEGILSSGETENFFSSGLDTERKEN